MNDEILSPIQRLNRDLTKASFTLSRDEARFLVDAYYVMQDNRIRADGPEAALQEAKANYHKDLWRDQPMRPEVWVEKEALSDVVGQMCNKLRVDFFPCRGYVSQSEQWAAGQRLARYIQKGQTPIVFHFGDHDPSGVDMTRDNTDRLSLFAGTPINVVRLALNMNQIEKYQPPPNPAKKKDARYESYFEKYGDESWELDALDPRIIQSLIEDAVMRVRDHKLWDEALKEEALDLQLLSDMISEVSGASNEPG